MKIRHLTANILLAGLLLLPFAGRAADIDIYSGLTGAAGVPNVLIVFDNAANFSSNAPAGVSTCTLTNTATGVTATNSLNGTVGGIEQCAYYNVLAALPVNADGTARVNIGFMVYNANNITDHSGANCSGSNGGCLVYPLAPMSGATRTDLLNWITTWRTSGSAGPGYIKSAGEATAATMQEAWAYYAGQTGLSGRSYAGIQPASGCQKNFVIFLGNSFDNAGSPGDGGSASPLTALTAAYGANPIPTPNPILGTVSTSCGAFLFPSGNSHVTGGYYADEWARFMRSTDIFSATSGTQSIVTYTIGVLGPSCQASYAATLTSMASNGGGKYFATSDTNSVVQALLTILNEVQAVNSVFAAATLPVSVNAQGTYLNQIYMGMFRPDAQGNPRWVGNLKQYQFQFDANKNLYLADATGQPAISSGGTGFITPGAASFWSCTNPTHAATLAGPANYTPYSSLPTCAADPANGFWLNFQDYVSNTSGGAFDLQDGEVVEKGGVAQQLRLANLTDNYATSPAAPRTIYSWCPNDPNNLGGTCIADLTNSANSFSTSNAAITASLLGTGLNLAVTSITRAGNVATVTTVGSHGLVAGNTITISGATPNDYNGLVTVISVPTRKQFTYTVVEYPPTPATIVTSGGAGGYVANLPSAFGYPLSSMTRVAAGTAANATVTAVSPGNTFNAGNSVTISGATPANYNLTQNISCAGSCNPTFTFPVAVQPTPTPTGSYVVNMTNNVQLNVAGYSCATSSKIATVTTSTNHGLFNGDQIFISGDTATPASKNANGGPFAPITVLSPTSFTYATGGCPTPVISGMKIDSGPASPLAITSLTRNETAVGTATVTATIASASQFAVGDLISVTLASGTQNANETGYLVSSTPIACATNPCGTTFTYTIATTPATQPSGTMTAAVALPAQPVTSLSRVFPGGTTATATVSGAGFTNGMTVAINTAPGTTLAAHEGAYTGNWPITCVGASPCTTFTYGPLAITPVSPATGNISASNPGLTPDRTSLINWARGEDNYGDEASLCPAGTTAGTGNCPSPAVTARPSMHADTLHSRPITLNYGGTTGVIVFYGTNDGIYHAVNGNQTGTIGTVPAGAELWGFIAPDFYNKLNRQRTNSPVLLLPSTPPGIIPPPSPKDYFFDGPTGMYQQKDANGNITRAIIYISTRRGGRFLYAMDVTHPLKPFVLWRISANTPGFGELGQTWSLPQAAKVAGYANPVLFFGAGYDDGAEDAEPPTADTMGRGIFAVDALTGDLVWSAAPSATGSWHRTASYAGSQCTETTLGASCLVDGMNYSIPTDLTLVDRDFNGTVDRLYAVDTGGNVWRVDLEPAAGNTPDKWQVTELAALGCTLSTPCTPRKFFYRAEIIDALSGSDYDAIFIGSGDREHPLYSNQSYGVINRLYMVKDLSPGLDSIGQTAPTIEGNLDDCTGTADPKNPCSTATTGAASPLPYCKLTRTQQHGGYYVTMGPGEKVVNAPLAVGGAVYFGTNQPVAPSTASCTTNLGVARGYWLDPFCGIHNAQIYDGGGMPPSPVAGVVNIGNQQAIFCIGCGGQPSSGASAGGSVPVCNSAECGTKLTPYIPGVRSRTYWYIDGK